MISICLSLPSWSLVSLIVVGWWWLRELKTQRLCVGALERPRGCEAPSSSSLGVVSHTSRLATGGDQLLEPHIVGHTLRLTSTRTSIMFHDTRSLLDAKSFQLPPLHFTGHLWPGLFIIFISFNALLGTSVLSCFTFT